MIGRPVFSPLKEMWYWEYCRRKGVTDRAFLTWTERVERLVRLVLHIGLLELPDEMYREAFEEGTNPVAMAHMILAQYV